MHNDDMHDWDFDYVNITPGLLQKETENNFILDRFRFP